MAQFFTDWLKETNQLEDLYLGEKQSPRMILRRIRIILKN